ncbi:MAG: hypothetical protein AAB691_04675 [Patescibacteria group bacterium]
MPTKSEQLFEEFCDRNNVRWRRIETAEDEGEERPDYELVLSGERVIAEVKQFDPTVEEQRLIEELELRGSTGVFGGEPGDRARKKIDKGARQLRTLAKGVSPTLLVLYNNVAKLTCRHTDPYAIKTAMYGLEAFTIATNCQTPTVLERDFAPRGKKRVTPSANTSLSAIGVLWDGDAPQLGLTVYHNIHARFPLKADWVRCPLVRHYTLGAKTIGQFRDWVEI